MGLGFTSAHLFTRSAVVMEGDQAGSYQEDRSHEYSLRLLVTGSSYKLFGIYESTVHVFEVNEPGRIFLIGTDAYGRDEFSRVLFGGQLSVSAGIVATFITLLAGSIVGIIAGYYGGWVDELLMGVNELFLSLPVALFPAGSARLLATTSEHAPRILSIDRRDRIDRLGPPGAVVARSGAQFAKPKLRSCCAWLRCDRFLSS